MSSLLITNIKKLVQTGNGKRGIVKGKEMAVLPAIDNAFLLVDNGIIIDFGTMDKCPENAGKIIDASGKMVFPTWCDSHTHLVFANSREMEFEARIKGISYEEIARRGGGILNSAKKLREMPEDVLVEKALERLSEIKKHGTGAVEIKSGYGLSYDGELKMLRIIRQLKEKSELTIKSTFLGAHALPLEYKNNRNGYIDLIIKKMIPQIAAEKLADFIDVFCEKVAFTPEETDRIINAGLQYGLIPKIHTNQFNSMGGIEVSVNRGALSVDHLEVITDEEINYLKNSKTMPVLLPSAPFFLGDNYPPARKIIDAGLPVALATDYNPGSSPSGKMPFVISLASIKMKMTPEEAINAATVNGAYAMDVQDELGTIAIGKKANFFVTKPIPSVAFMPYAFGNDIIESVYLSK